MRLRWMFLVAGLLVAWHVGLATAAQAPRSTRKDEAELKRITRELLAAVAPGKWDVWERYVDNDLIYVAEDGHVYSKADLKEGFGPLPKGYIGSLEPDSFKIVMRGDFAVVHHQDDERLEIFGHKLRQRFKQTSVFHRRGGQWRLLANQVFVVADDPPTITVSPEALAEYAGDYQLAASMTMAVKVEDGRLKMQRGQRPAAVLMPEFENVFFVSGQPRSRHIFLRDAKGNVDRLVHRREGHDLVWSRVLADTTRKR